MCIDDMLYGTSGQSPEKDTKDMRYVGTYGYDLLMYRDAKGKIHGYERRHDGGYTHVITAEPYRTDDGMWDI